MSRSSQRVQLARGFILHHRPFRDSSVIAELWTREHGRLTAFAHGARRGSAARAAGARIAALQPFRALLLSWSGRGEAPQLTGAEPAPICAPPPAAAHLLSAFYLNELVLKLTTRHDPHPQLFDEYELALAQLAPGTAAQWPLRRFELRLLQLIGYGLSLATEADTGQPVLAEALYCLRPGMHGVVRVQARGVAEPSPPAGAGPAVQGRVLLQLAAGAALEREADLRQARRLLRAALDHCLEGRALATREVARAMLRYAR